MTVGITRSLVFATSSTTIAAERVQVGDADDSHAHITTLHCGLGVLPLYLFHDNRQVVAEGAAMGEIAQAEILQGEENE